MKVILEGAVCRGCGGEVVYCITGRRRLGWLHESGAFHCPPVVKEPVVKVPRSITDRKAYKREWMRRYRARAA